MSIWDGSGGGRYRQLSSFITATPKVQVSGGRLTLELDAPRDSVMYTIYPSDYYSNIVVSPDDAKWFSLYEFVTSNRYYVLSMVGPGSDGTGLVYVDKDVTINGINHDHIWNNVVLKKGWNYIYYDYDGNYFVVTGSQTMPSGAVWIVQQN